MIEKRFIYLICLLFLLSIKGYGRNDTITLRDCIKAATEHAFINAQFGLNNELAELKIANAKVTNLPSLHAFGKATYQSDAISIAIPGGSIEVDLFQYNTGIEARQKIFDGGIAGKASRLEAAVLNAESGKINTKLYKLTNRVTNMFFQVLLMEKKIAIISLKEEILQNRFKEMQLAVDNGILKRNELESMQAEVLIVKQQHMGFDRMKLQLLSSLRIITGLHFAGNQFVIQDSMFLLPEKSRPEKLYFAAEQQKLESLAELQQAKNLPKLYAFGQAGYSYPSLNFFENQSDYYYIVGAKLSWTIFDWKQNRRKVEIIRKQKESVAIRESEFDQNISIATEKEVIAQEQLKKMIALDNEIIRQRSLVTKGSEVALEEGTITATDYLENLNTEMKARTDAESRKLELHLSYIQLKILEGIDLSTL